MGLFKKTSEEKTAIAKLRAADKALHDNYDRERRAGIDWDTPKHKRLIRAANEAADKVGFWHGGTKRRS